MQTYQILLLIGVALASVFTSYFLVRMFSLLWKNRNTTKIKDNELEDNLKYMIISIVLLTLCSLVYCVLSIVD